MNDFIIPNWHPLLVHFTVALVISSTVFFVLSKLVTKRTDTFVTVAKWMLWSAAGVTILTVLAGFAAFNSVNHDDVAHKVMKVHRNWALVTGVLVLLVAIWTFRASAVSNSMIAASLVLAGLVGVTGYLGSELVYRHGLGVMRMPAASGEGHDHGAGGHGEEATEGDLEEKPHEHGEDQGDGGPTKEETHQDGHSDHAGAPETKDHDDTGSAAHEHSVEKAKKTHAHEGMPALDFAKHFQKALFSGDFDMVAQSFAPNAIVFENGTKEASLAGYLENHLKPEMPMLKAAKRQVTDQTALENENSATVTTSSVLMFLSQGKKRSFNSVETLGLVRIAGEWKIGHAHWSSRPIQDAH